MPIIRVDYDNEQISSEEVHQLSRAVRDIVSDVTSIEDVFVYANSSEIKIKVAPVEIFVEMSAHKIENLDVLTANFVSRIRTWKAENNFSTLVNLSVIPMPWKIEVEI